MVIGYAEEYMEYVSDNIKIIDYIDEVGNTSKYYNIIFVKTFNKITIIHYTYGLYLS